MADRLLFGVLLVLSVYGAGGWMVRQKHLLSIYYESKCPDSKRFILEQLVPAMSLLKDSLELQFVPYGKAVGLREGGFVCHHGPEECLGNLVQDCALFVAGPGFDDLKKLAYVECETKLEAGSKGNFHCAREAGIPLHRLYDCVSSEKGELLQQSSEYLTSLVKPSFIPTITYDQMFDPEFQQQALTDLTASLCQRLSHTRACAEYFNSVALADVLQPKSTHFNHLLTS